jgi:hypothetical protein
MTKPTESNNIKPMSLMVALIMVIKIRLASTLGTLSGRGSGYFASPNSISDGSASSTGALRKAFVLDYLVIVLAHIFITVLLLISLPLVFPHSLSILGIASIQFTHVCSAAWFAPAVIAILCLLVWTKVGEGFFSVTA